MMPTTANVTTNLRLLREADPIGAAFRGWTRFMIYPSSCGWSAGSRAWLEQHVDPIIRRIERARRERARPAVGKHPVRAGRVGVGLTRPLVDTADNPIRGRRVVAAGSEVARHVGLTRGDRDRRRERQRLPAG